VSGNGQTALAGLVSGLYPLDSGSIRIKGAHPACHDVPNAIAAGIGRIPEDRNVEGSIGDMSIWENTILERVWSPEFSAFGVVKRKAAMAATETILRDYDVRGATPDRRIRLLSGGNMQKLILGRVLSPDPDILVAAQPTRGLDEGAITSVHERLIEARGRGAGVLLISEDLDEVMALSDRICAIVDGRLSPAIPAAQANAQLLGLMMAGDWSTAATLQSQETRHAI